MGEDYSSHGPLAGLHTMGGADGEPRRIGMFVDAGPEGCQHIVDTVSFEAKIGRYRPIA